jgi:D-3-phosphoglycerate dehydrogenase
MTSIYISTTPFATLNKSPLIMLEDRQCSVRINSAGRKLSTEMLLERIGDAEILIAGTEKLTAEAMDALPNLKMICRVGIGLDSVDLIAAKKHGITVSHTPDAPSPAVAELTIGLMLNLLRQITFSTEGMRDKKWVRHFGKRLDQSVVGLFGFGRIGSLVAQKLKALGVQEILVHDIDPDRMRAAKEMGCTPVTPDNIYKKATIISLHVPLTPKTKGMIKSKQIQSMQSDTVLINTARGGVIDEHDLYTALIEKRIMGSAIDVFEEEPYQGLLTTCPNVILTAHMGSMTVDCRTQMEIEACEEACRYLDGVPILFPAPDTASL